MWKNYLLTSLRSLRKEKFYVIINLLSLAMAFAFCTIAFFNFMYNQTYNHSFEGYDSIYKINAKPQSATSSKQVGISPVALMPALIAQFPDLKVGRFHKGTVNLKVKDRMFNESVGFVDPSFLDMVRFNHTSITMGQDEVIVTEAVATRLFGSAAQVKGELVEAIFPNGEKKLLSIGQVIPTPNQNTSFKFAILLHFDHYIKNKGIKPSSWQDWVSGTFVALEGQEKQHVESTLQDYLPIQNVANTELELASYRLDKIADWAHFEKDLHGRSFGSVLHPASVTGTISSAVAILMLACFNFFNTTIATSGKRLKEISMRKVIGGRRKDIIIQFMLESALQVVSAFLLSLLIAYILIGPYNAMFRFELVQFQPQYLEPYLVYAVGTCLFTILLSSAYPAFYVSKFGSLEILKNRVKLRGNSLLTKSLLTIQFSVCFYNIFALGVFVENANYQEKLDRGYDVKKFINIPVQAGQFTQLKNEIKQNAGFNQVFGTNHLVGFSDREVSFEYEGVVFNMGKLEVGAGYLSGLGVDFIAGQDFDESRFTNEQLIIVNRMFNEAIGANLIGQSLTINDKSYRVHGVTDDFNIKNIMLSNKIRPTVFFYAPDSLYHYAVVACEEDQLRVENNRLETIWYNLFPEQLYAGFYQEEVFESVKTTNLIMVRINVFIGIVSILISILGLYALISLTAQRRIKEIGIRKALGASFGHVLRLLLKEVIWMIILSMVLGLTAGAYVINRLLDIIYAYHIEIDGFNYLFSVLLIFAVAALSLGYKVISTAKMNPVTQLRVQ